MAEIMGEGGDGAILRLSGDELHAVYAALIIGAEMMRLDASACDATGKVSEAISQRDKCRIITRLMCLINQHWRR